MSSSQVLRLGVLHSAHLDNRPPLLLLGAPDWITMRVVRHVMFFAFTILLSALMSSCGLGAVFAWDRATRY
jgi:hypothetical protein